MLPVLSSSAPEREGIWHEVKRKSTERLKVTVSKERTSKQGAEVCPLQMHFMFLSILVFIVL